MDSIYKKDSIFHNKEKRELEVRNLQVTKTVTKSWMKPVPFQSTSRRAHVMVIFQDPEKQPLFFL